jgi:hypothetical protein
MMQYYFIKGNLWGVPKGTVERFSTEKAAQHLAAEPGCLEPFDAKKHGKAKGADAALKVAQA